MNALHSHQDSTGASLPGPLFTPRPGWGGQLNAWLRSHSNTFITTIILIAVIALTASILWNRLPARTASYESPRETPVAASIDVLAIAGDGVYSLSSRAIDLYCTVREPIIKLDSIEHIAAVTILTNDIGSRNLEPNDVLSFPVSDLQDAISSAQHLSSRQRAAWGKLLQ